MFWKIIRWTPRRRIGKNTEIVQIAIEKNDIDIWTHPNRYFKLDVVEVAKTCAARGTLLELNSKRISIRPIDFERCLAVGAKFIIGSDAHTPKRVGDFARVEEFLKNCDYKEDDIINLKQTWTQYKNARSTIKDDNMGNDKTDAVQKKHRRWGRSK